MKSPQHFDFLAARELHGSVLRGLKCFVDGDSSSTTMAAFMCDVKRLTHTKVDINACVQEAVAKALAMDWPSFAFLSDCKLFEEWIFQELTVRRLALKDTSQHVVSS